MTSLKTIDFPALYSDSLYFSSGALTRQIEKVAKEAWKPSGLHPSQAYLLKLITDSQLPYPTLFAKGMELSPSTITRMLGKLEKKQLITRSAYTNLSVVIVTDKLAANCLATDGKSGPE